ncbi:MAG: GLPGLI family protein [Prevotellaceae bacterium]|jgi:GLPGLI family protein|nr:GLPGLI family protein [Prevotellaceae bacterium]
MKKTLITAIVFICVLFEINAQQQIDNIQLKCTYRYDYISPANRKLVDTMMLEVGKDICKFYSYHNYIVDSIRKNSEPGTQMLYKSTANKYKIYLNHPANKTTVIDFAGTLNYFEYIEDFELPKWTVHKETQTILSHPCLKATCRFRGRDYIAWYATDIPISRGPYKFAGLPGLILKIADTEDLYSFECTGIKKANAPMYKIYSTDAKTIRTTRAEFINAQNRMYTNPKAVLVDMLKAVGTINTDDFMKQFPDTKKSNYNPIELE